MRAWSAAAAVLPVTAVLETNISQGSVATPLRFGRICNDRFIANFLTSVKNFENRSIFGEDMNKSLQSCFFDSRCSYFCDVID